MAGSRYRSAGSGRYVTSKAWKGEPQHDRARGRRQEWKHRRRISQRYQWPLRDRQAREEQPEYDGAREVILSGGGSMGPSPLKRRRCMTE